VTAGRGCSDASRQTEPEPAEEANAKRTRDHSGGREGFGIALKRFLDDD